MTLHGCIGLRMPRAFLGGPELLCNCLTEVVWNVEAGRNEENDECVTVVEDLLGLADSPTSCPFST